MPTSIYNGIFESNDGARMQSPRPETPEPFVRQGRRNDPVGVQLLDDEGAISDQFFYCLGHIFAQYCTPRPAHEPTSPSKGKAAMGSDNAKDLQAELILPPEGAYFTPEALDRWATDTNGTPLPPEAKEELNYLDATEEGYLTFKGFLQIYQLQTENDEEETWRDLSTHGFDRKLTLVTTRREDMESDPDTPAQKGHSRETTPTAS